jgi:hypothetical protein
MNRRLSLVWGIAAVAVALVGRPEPAAARDSEVSEGFRCPPGRVVSRGDHMVEVRKRCGEPDFVTQRTDKRKVKVKVRRWVEGVMEEVSEERVVEVLVDEWTYDFGPRRFLRFVSFEDGRVIGVRTGGYGTKVAQE